MKYLGLFLAFIAIINCGHDSDQKGHDNKKTKFFLHATFDQCQGKDAHNYTFVAKYTRDSLCNPETAEFDESPHLIANYADGHKVVNSLETLTTSVLPLGAYDQFEALYLVTSGNLEGKFAYEKVIYHSEVHLKKCSSVLGVSYIATKSYNLYISDNLNVNLFTNPTGAFDTFHQSTSTECKGAGLIF